MGLLGAEAYTASSKPSLALTSAQQLCTRSFTASSSSCRCNVSVAQHFCPRTASITSHISLFCILALVSAVALIVHRKVKLLIRLQLFLLSSQEVTRRHWISQSLLSVWAPLCRPSLRGMRNFLESQVMARYLMSQKCDWYHLFISFSPLSHQNQE